MAKVQFGISVTKLKGSINGVTYQGGRFGPVLRARPRPVRRARTVQPVRRATVGFLSRYFSSEITAAEKILWQDYANAHPRNDSFGQSYTLQANQQFTSLNLQAMRLGGVAALYDSPPLAVPAAALASLVASDGVASGAIVLTWTFQGVGSADDFVEIWISPANMGENRAFEIQPMKFSTSKAGNLLTATIADLVPEAWYWFNVRYVDEFGQVTAWMNEQWQAPTI